MLLPGADHGRRDRGRRPPTSCRSTTRAYALEPAGRGDASSSPRQAPAAGLARPAVPGRSRSTSPARSSGIDYVLAKYAALTAALFVLMALPLIDPVRRRAARRSCRVGDQTPRLPAGRSAARSCSRWCSPAIGLVIAAVTPRRGFGVAAIIAVLARRSPASSPPSRASPTTRTQRHARRLRRAVLAVHPGRRRADLRCSAPSTALAGRVRPGALGGAVFLAVVVALVAGLLRRCCCAATGRCRSA